QENKYQDSRYHPKPKAGIPVRFCFQILPSCDKLLFQSFILSYCRSELVKLVFNSEGAPFSVVIKMPGFVIVFFILSFSYCFHNTKVSKIPKFLVVLKEKRYSMVFKNFAETSRR